MSCHVAIVTDSTAYLPQRTMERHGITAVPLTVVLGDQALDEGTGARRYWPLTYVETWIPILFALTYLAAFVAVLSG